MSDIPNLGDFEALSFDCYGTLIDWETGLLRSLKPLLARALPHPTSREILEAYAEAEGEAERTHPAEIYPEILARCWSALAARFGVPDDAVERNRFGHSVGDWPAFPDSPEALVRLKARYKLIILSNIDRESFAKSNRRLKVEFDRVITAQDVGSYKPDLRNFEALIGAAGGLGIPFGKLLHVAQSLYHDHVPAKRIGLTTAWIDRRSGMEGGGATLPAKGEVTPHFVFTSLAALADAAGV